MDHREHVRHDIDGGRTRNARLLADALLDAIDLGLPSAQVESDWDFDLEDTALGLVPALPEEELVRYAREFFAEELAAESEPADATPVSGVTRALAAPTASAETPAVPLRPSPTRDRHSELLRTGRRVGGPASISIGSVLRISAEGLQ